MCKRIRGLLSLVLAMILSFACLPAAALAEGEIPALPTVSATNLAVEGLNYATNFQLATPSDAQSAYYGAWNAEIEVSFNKAVTLNADGTGDGYLSARCEGFNVINWTPLPIGGITLADGEKFNLMEYVFETESGAEYQPSFGDLRDACANVDLGLYLTPEFLAANPDVKATFNVRLYNETESHILASAAFSIPELPAATITNIVNKDLTFAMNFKTTAATTEQLSYYGDWYADFELTVNKDVTFYAKGGADGYLAGQYDGEWEEWHGEWVNAPVKSAVTLKANEPVRIMSLAAEQLDEPGLRYTYREVYEVVQDFNCGVYFTPEFMAANPDLKVTLELKMYNPEDKAETYIIGETRVFENNSVAINKETGKGYTDLQTALSDAKANQTVLLVRDVTDWWIDVMPNTTFDLNGNVLTSDYTSVFGAIIDSSADNSGRLVTGDFHKQNNNPQLPIMTDNGYAFVEILKFESKVRDGGREFVFLPMFETAADAMLLNRIEESGVSIQVDVTWRNAGEDGIHTQHFLYDSSFVNEVIGSRLPNGKYGRAFLLKINSTNIAELTFKAKVISAGVTAFS